MRIRTLYAVALVVILTLLAIFPNNWWMLPCPLYQWTRWQCPFCGGQRMAQALLHGDIVQAFRHNPLLMCALPLILLALFRFFFPHFAAQYPRATGKALFTDKALFFYLITCFLWGIARNVGKFI